MMAGRGRNAADRSLGSPSRIISILYNGTWQNVLYVGVIELIGNEVHLLLHDSGVPLPLVTFFGCVVCGANRIPGRSMDQGGSSGPYGAGSRHDGPRSLRGGNIGLFRSRRDTQRSLGRCLGFVVGSIAFGLAAARFISQPEWLRE